MPDFFIDFFFFGIKCTTTIDVKHPSFIYISLMRRYKLLLAYIFMEGMEEDIRKTLANADFVRKASTTPESCSTIGALTAGISWL